MSVSFTKLNNVKDEAAITAAIRSIHTRSNSLQLDIHRVLVAISVRWAASGDMRPVAMHVNTLLAKDQLGGVRKNAIRAWVETFMKLKFIEEGDNKGQFYVPKSLSSGAHMDVKELSNKRWWEFKPEPEYQPINDPLKLMQQLCAKMEKDRAKLGKASKVTPEMIQHLRDFSTEAVQ